MTPLSSLRDAPPGVADATTSLPTSYAETRETHSAVVFLVGERAYKLKKPVDLGFLDFSTRTRRLAVLQDELALNRRLAPDVYLGISDVLDVDGRPLDHLLVMRRMPEQRRLAHLVRTGADVAGHLAALAHLMATFHAHCPRDPDVDAAGTRDALRARWQSNFDGVQPFVGSRLDAGTVETVRSLVESYLEGRGCLFDDRIGREAIVDGHGDLLAEDIFCLADGPRVLDCIEFDDRLRHLDRLDDVACLAMDLERLGSPESAEGFLHAYVALTADTAPVSLVHHYIAYRAFMRAKVACLPHGRDTSSSSTPAELLDLAHRHLREGRVSLVLVGGAPGTGKSTLSTRLADALGCTVLSSDRIRKELAGLPAETHAPAAVGQGIYTAEWTDRTYREMLRRAEGLLAMGESVILDATWGDAGTRSLATDLARRTSSDLAELQCDLPAEVAAERIAVRESASDADPVVASALRAGFEDWPEAARIDTRPPVDLVVAQVRHRLQPWRTTALTTRPRLPAD